MIALVLDVLSWALLLLGGSFCVLGAAGVLRLPDFYTRTHAAGLGDTLGAACVLIGCALQAERGLIATKLLLILGFMWLSSAVSSHSLVKAAMAQGLKPLLAEPSAPAVPSDAAEAPTSSR